MCKGLRVRMINNALVMTMRLFKGWSLGFLLISFVCWFYSGSSYSAGEQ